MKIVTICGSIRLQSSNHLILEAVKQYGPNHEFINLDLTKLPYFDPDNQYGDQVPQIVLEMRALVSQSDLILISTPEYAHGIPGILKNGLEWTFCEETGKKIVFVIIGSAQGEWARDQLIEILTTMDFLINSSQCLIIHGARKKISQDGKILDQITRTKFENFCNLFFQ